MPLLRRAITTAVILASFLAVLPASHAEAAERVAPVTPIETQKSQILADINAERVAHGLVPVHLNARMAPISQDWADVIATSTEWPDLRHNPEMAHLWGCGSIGEIAAMAGAFDISPEAPRQLDGHQAVRQWIESAPHHAIMLDPRLTEIGIGVSYTRNWLQLGPDLVPDYSGIWIVNMGVDCTPVDPNVNPLAPPVTKPTPAPVQPPSATPNVKRHGRAHR